MAAVKGIKELSIYETPIAVIDFETTGLTPGVDRVVEVSVYRMEPGKKPVLAFDTLVNPQRPMSATEIHGITEDDVANAPVFSDIAGGLVDSLSGCVVSAYNVYFDIKFLAYELNQLGIPQTPPHFCLMYMRPMLGLGKRCNLEKACEYHNVDYKAVHIASSDAEASASLMERYLEEMTKQKVRTFGDLARLKKYKFTESFVASPMNGAGGLRLTKSERFLSRSGFQSSIEINPERQALAEYWEALRMVVADLEVTDEELAQMLQLRKEIHLPKEKIRMLHAKAFASVISQFIDDKWLDDKEVLKLRRLKRCLSRLGWAPGD
ncbi:DNA polymerase III PolC-type [Anaerohalosphaera lusitana]|uniref:DNA polymerase III PolC-type n=1 Tax=Anaerohalosphaera lusitana TaxID=1936003 RepID=A0A1U9NQ50_9BACT|nr:3'-5' exonuclease [Anaerohalosphaera lusitana]AQT70062.1 DNA polymerase III PolC-type [Anaerohalosphaera lusitana]